MAAYPSWDILGDVVGCDDHAAAAGVVLHAQGAVDADRHGGPQITVGDAAGARAGAVLDHVLAVVLAGDHDVADTAFEAVGEHDSGAGDGAVLPVVGAHLGVQLPHQIVGLGDHESDLVDFDVGDVGVEHLVRQLVPHAGPDPA
ncbi:hypothetical protein, partial [Rhodococcus koreensis]